jgi:hypothetical protein
VRFFASVGTPAKSVRHLLIDAPTWHAANQYASRELGTESLIVHQTGEDSGVDVELRFAGSDSGQHGGGKNGRRLQIRKPGEEWKDDGP